MADTQVAIDELEVDGERNRLADNLSQGRGVLLGYLDLQQRKESRLIDILHSSQLCNDETAPKDPGQPAPRSAALRTKARPTERQATREWMEAGKRCRSRQKQMQLTRQRLADMTSDFGSLSSDGETHTEGKVRKREWRRRRQLNHLRIENYRPQPLLAGAAVQVSAVPRESSRAWSGKSIQWGGSNCPENDAINSTAKQRIREWSQKMGMLRAKPDYSAWYGRPPH
ncbi:hypothetical protein LTR08_004315 [Meristemomyces frigidus]|nr:hypothetical protein LTR08_004315 [Meristemomyces frigidus]